MAQRRKRLLTPKGEAVKSLQQAKSTLRDLERIVEPNREEDFVYRLNDFLRTARTVPEFLSKEQRGSSDRVYTSQQRGVPAMRHWIDAYIDTLSPEDRERLDFLIHLREVSSHDLVIRPDQTKISEEVFDARMGAGSTIGNLLYQHEFGWSEAENVIQSIKITTQYFLSNRRFEDVVSFCKRAVVILEKMVSEAYSKFP
jgi:anion-transporting  ArsA/GET3 family ATPase